MSKKIISLLLCLIMLMGVSLVSCGDDEIAMSSPLDTRTLTMYLITDKMVFKSRILDYVKDSAENPANYTAEDIEWCENWRKANVPEGQTFEEFYEEQMAIAKQYEAVEEAINLITKTQFSVQLDLYYMPEDIYYEQIDSKFDYMANNAKNYTGVIKGSLAVENEDGVPEYVYPEVPDSHVDILFIGDEYYFNKFYEEGKLSSLSEQLNDSKYKPLKTIIYPSYLQAVTRYNGTANQIYAIPNNVPTGEYTYLLFNKALADRYKVDVNKIATWEDCASYLSLVAEYEKDYIPVLLPEDVEINNGTVALEDLVEELVLNNHYWSVSYEEKDGAFSYSVDPDEFSLLGSGYSKDATQDAERTTWIPFDNMLKSSSHQSQLASLMYFNNNGYFGHKENENDKYALSLFEGDLNELEAYKDDYYAVLVDSPRVNGEGAYEGMFAISSGTTNISKAMQIISLLSTDPEFRNLLAYGIEGENYTLDADGYVVKLENNLYNVDVEKSGNIFNAYAPDSTYTTYDAEGNIEDVWGLAKQYAADVTVHPLFNFNIDNAMRTFSYKLDNKAIDYLDEVTDEYWAKILEIDKNLTIAEIRTVLSDLGDELNSDSTISKLRNYRYSTANETDARTNGTSVYELYHNWLIVNGLAK